MIDDSPAPDAYSRWPEGAIVYQVYPRSFQDTNGDGVGDLPGIISRLDYLKDLGVNALWLSPFYPSPMADFGYDVTDYCNVHPLFGSLEDFDRLLSEVHSRQMRLIIDLVPNHTSDEHAWFQESRQSRDNAYADWYVWRDAYPSSEQDNPLPPNNWRDALTGRSAWRWEPARQQFYLHSFDVKQPDLNWSNPKVRVAIKNVMRFWLDKGVDGFRVDAVYWMAKEPLLSDDDLNPDYVEGEDSPYEALLHNNSQGWPVVYAYLAEMADVLKEPLYQDRLRFMITEAYPDRHNAIAAYMAFYVGMNPEVAAPFNFEGLSLPWEASRWRRFLMSFHHALEQFDACCVPSYAFGNHDQSRLVSRLGEPAARSAAVLLLTLPGMAFIYNGEEIGMHDVPVPPERVHDPAALGDPRHGQGRDPERTPMQWDDSPGAGFTNGEPWLPLSDDYRQRNVAAQKDDPTSFLCLYRDLARLRNRSEALKRGAIKFLHLEQEQVLGFVREQDGERLLTLINFSDAETHLTLPEPLGQLLVSSYAGSGNIDVAKLRQAGQTEIELFPHEGAVFRQ